jgi:hypothetical protein
MSVAGVIVYWDYDTQWGADRSRSGQGPKRWGADEFVQAERLLEIHAEYDIPACFAVVGAAALAGGRPYHDPAQIRRLHQAGHEIASHSHQHEWLPGLGPTRLRLSLSCSREALEDCIGAPVVSFVPPYNQPFDFAARWSFSLSERRTAGRQRVDVPELCAALGECGYLTSRVSYRSLYRRLGEALLGRRLDSPVAPEWVGSVVCIRLNTPGGFGRAAHAMLERCSRVGGLVVVYGHPHSLGGDDEQSEAHLRTWLDRVRVLRSSGCVRVLQPRDLIAGD